MAAAITIPAPIIHHDFNAEGTNKGTLGSIYDINMTNSLPFVNDQVHVQKGLGAFYSGELGNMNNNECIMNDSNATFTSSSNGFFVSFWFKHNYQMTTDNFYYSKKTRAELLLSGYSEPQLKPDDPAEYASHIVNSMFYQLLRPDSSVTQLGYNSVTPNNVNMLLWVNNPWEIVNINLGVADNQATNTIGIFDGDTDFHHMLIDYGSAGSTTIKVYVDNMLMATQDVATLYNITYSQINIQSGKQFVDTYINDFRIYNYAANAEIVDTIYKLGSNTNLTSLSGITMSNLQNAGASVSQLIEIGGLSDADIAGLIAGGGLSGMDLINLTTRIKIHSNFTISDGTSSAAFTTADTDYTGDAFAAKLSTDLGNTVTFGFDNTSNYPSYLQFANAATLTGMPKYIFAIPFSDFSVKAGGRVNFRNVNLDAEMTIATIKRESNPFNNEAVFTSDSTVIDNINLTSYSGASNPYVNQIDHYTNIINDDTLFPTAFSAVDINYDGSIIACGNSTLGSVENGAIQVYKRDATASSGWIQIGSTIFGDDYDQYATSLTLSYDGQIVAGAAAKFSLNGTYQGIYGYFQAWKQDPSNTSVEPIGWTPHGDKLKGINPYKWYNHHMSGDGNTIIWWSQDLTTIKIYKHNSGTNTWDEITHSFSIAYNGLHFRAKLSYDGSILVMGDMGYDTFKGRVQVYERDSSDQFTQIGSDIVGTTTGTNASSGSRLGSSIAINKNGDVFSFNEHISGSWKNYVYKRDGSGWSQMGDVSTEGADGQHDMSLDDIGHSFAVSSTYHQGQAIGKFYIFEYNTTDSTWSHIITNNSYQGGGYYNGYLEGGNSAILGVSNPSGFLGLNIRLSGDNSKMIVSGVPYMHIYSMPGEVVTTASSTIPAGDSFINNFVSKISTDINQSLSYDADNKNITFDGISENIEISITSTDTTVFDTSITEITVAANTLPFLTYGQPEPSYIKDGVIFFGTIKIHENFTIRDGTSESAFTTGDADYTQITFAAKLSGALVNNTVTYGVTNGSGYLQFANAAILTGMPKYIFAIPFSDFSVKAGGRVNFRNVNLDAEMTIATIKRESNPFNYDFVFVTDTQVPLHIAFTGIADSYGFNFGRTFSNIVNNATKYFDVPIGACALNTDGSIMAMSNGQIGVKVYERDSNEPDGWKQIGGTIPTANGSSWFATELYLSSNGEIVTITDVRGGSVNFAGYTVVYKRNPAVDIGWEIMGGQYDMQGDNVGANDNRDYQHYASLSYDGTIVAVGTSNHSPGKVRVFNYDDVSNSWIQQGSTLTSTNGTTRRPTLSGDGTIIAILDITNGIVDIYSRDSTTSTVWNPISNISVTGVTDININKNGDIFAACNDTHIYVYNRDTNDASGWSLIGSPITLHSGGGGGNSVQIDDDGHTVTCCNRNYSTYHGILMIYKYNTALLAWEHTVTDNQIVRTATDRLENRVVAGGTDPIVGIHANHYFAKNTAISGDGSKIITTSSGVNGSGSECYIFTLPTEIVTTTSSTLPAGDSFINNFVSKISTDINQSLSYDADNKNITFDGISENIEISITSTDTTVFDTSITEITVAANTLPFLTYGQPEPSYLQYALNGITYDEFIANGVTSPELTSLGVTPGWDTVTDANNFDKSYVLGYMDVSGYMVIRGENHLTVMGNTTIDGNINMIPGKTLSSSVISVNSRLFVNDDISANGKFYVGGDLSVNGQFSSNFAVNSIPYSKIKDSPIITGNVKIGEDVSFNGPSVEFGSGTTLNLSGTTNFNDNTSFDVNSIRFSGTIVSGNMVFKDTTISSVIVNGSATAPTIVTTSDYRIKTNVTELNDTYTVDNLVPIQYDNTLNGNHEYGFIAHELQPEYPDLVVGEKDGDEYQSVHYDGLIGVLVKEIQDLKKRVGVLNNR